jgi:hypothetical protein
MEHAILLKNNRKLILKTPVGEIYTHLTSVSCYCRCEDDDTIEHEVDLYEGTTTTSIKTNCETRNPSDRRQAITLHFKGEDGIDFDIQITQHKGISYFETVQVECKDKDKPKTCRLQTSVERLMLSK